MSFSLTYSSTTALEALSILFKAFRNLRISASISHIPLSAAAMFTNGPSTAVVKDFCTSRRAGGTRIPNHLIGSRLTLRRWLDLSPAGSCRDEATESSISSFSSSSFAVLLLCSGVVVCWVEDSTSMAGVTAMAGSLLSDVGKLL